MNKRIVGVAVLGICLGIVQVSLAANNHTNNGNSNNFNTSNAGGKANNMSYQALVARINELTAELNRLRGNSTSTVATAVDYGCVNTKVGLREDAIYSAYTAKNTCGQNALLARKTALNGAWGNSDAKTRNNAIKTVWNTYTQAANACQKAYRTAVQNAWNQFHTAAKACGLNSRGVEPEGKEFDI